MPKRRRNNINKKGLSGTAGLHGGNPIQHKEPKAAAGFLWAPNGRGKEENGGAKTGDAPVFARRAFAGRCGQAGPSHMLRRKE